MAAAGGNAAALLVGAYVIEYNPFQDQSRWWAAVQHTSDEALVPTSGGDWDDNGAMAVFFTIIDGMLIMDFN